MRAAALHENRFAAYARYALGEILLVVVGILIALQINNWNEERIDRRQIREYALNLTADIQQDLQWITPVQLQIERLIYQANAFAEYARARPFETVDNAEVYFLTRELDYRPYAWNRAAMEQLKSSGALRQITNQELVDKISAYDALTHHLDQDYINDLALLSPIRQLTLRICDANYPERIAIANWMDAREDQDSIAGYLPFRDSTLFQQIKASSLPLLSTNPGDMRLLANQMIDLADAIDPRVSSELPRLRTLGSEVVAMIKAEYGLAN